jgi:hypothetical protein
METRSDQNPNHAPCLQAIIAGQAGTAFFESRSAVSFHTILSNNGRSLMRLKMILRRAWAAIAVFAALFVAHELRAATIALPADADTYLRDATPRGALEFMDVRGGNIDFRGYLRFDLSSLGAAPITNATLTLTKVSGASRNDTIVGGRFALYGLNNDAGNTPQTWDEATFVVADKGTEDVTTLMGVTDLDEDVAGITETIVNGGADGGTITVTGAPLVSFLQGRLSDGGLATFILSNDDGTDRGYGLGTKENATVENHPVLTIEFVPEPSSVMLAIGALAAMGICFRHRS